MTFNFVSYDVCDDVTLSLAPPAEVVSRMGTPPRDRYPLVVVITQAHGSDGECSVEDENQIVRLLS